MPPRNRQRAKNLFVQPPADLPEEDPYGDAPAPPPAGDSSPQEPAEPAPAPAPAAARKPRRSAATKKAATKSQAAPPAGEGAPGDQSGATTSTSESVPGKEKVQVQLYIPAALHQAIADYKAEHWRGNEAPTYAQLSVWACEDHRAEVLERAVKIHQLRHGSTGDVRGDRAPRGTRKARPQVPIGPRYSPGDERFLEEMAAAAGPVDGDPVKRTTLVAAALAVAVKHEPTVREEPATEPEDEFFG